ncbi:MAG: hypothetical protein PHW02_00975 [bacterium]|nr:hypothetical protein [bacterium]
MKTFEIVLTMILFLLSSVLFMLYFVKRTMSTILLSFIGIFLLSFILMILGYENAALINLVLPGLVYHVFMIMIFTPPRK